MQRQVDYKRIERSRKIKYLYPYPGESVGKNVIHSGALIVAWVLSVPFFEPLRAGNERNLAAASIVFAISLMLEFFPIPRIHMPGKIVYGLFSASAFLLFISSLVIIGDSVVKQGSSTTSSTGTSLFAHFSYYLGIGEVVILVLGCIACIANIHTWIYDEENTLKEKQRIMEEEDRIKKFNDSLQG